MVRTGEGVGRDAQRPAARDDALRDIAGGEDRRTERRRKEIAIASVINLRDEVAAGPQQAFGQFLSSFLVSHPVPQGATLEALARDMHAQTQRVKRRKLYLQTLYLLACGGLAWRFMTPDQHKQMDAKNYPVWGGLSTLNVEANLERGARRRAGAKLPSRGVDRADLAAADGAGVGRRLPAHRDLVPHQRLHARRHRAHRRAAHDLREEARHETGRAPPGPARRGLRDAPVARPFGSHPAAPPPVTDRALEDRILALDPERVSAADVRQILVKGPTPRIMLLHGGIYPVHLAMESFGRFLVGMGYPEEKIRDPFDGTWSHSPYEDAERLAGIAAWYYEKTGMPPMLIGHSQGGMQAVKVLHVLNGEYSDKVAVWNPTTDFAEDRTSITDPLTGRRQAVVGMRVALRVGDRGRRRRVSPAESVEPARQAAHDSRYGRGVHGLRNRRRFLGVDAARRQHAADSATAARPTFAT